MPRLRYCFGLTLTAIFLLHIIGTLRLIPFENVWNEDKFTQSIKNVILEAQYVQFVPKSFIKRTTIVGKLLEQSNTTMISTFSTFIVTKSTTAGKLLVQSNTTMISTPSTSIVTKSTSAITISQTKSTANQSISTKIPAKKPIPQIQKPFPQIPKPLSQIPNPLFIHSAYLIDDNTIRLTTIRQCTSTSQLYVWVRTNSTVKSQLSQQARSNTIAAICPWWFAPKCHFVGYYSQIRLNTSTSVSSTLSSISPTLSSISISTSAQSIGPSIPVQDVRLNNKNSTHRLAVCLQPIFLFADWTLLVQFFETWIYHGVTKFYIYIHSMAPEVNLILRAYETNENITVERVSWSALPIVGEFDPNSLIYRTEVVTAINDCMLRARKDAEFVIASDLDEIIVPFKNRTMFQLIEHYHNKTNGSSPVAAMVIRSSNVAFQNRWQDATNPANLNFTAFQQVDREVKIWPAGARSKLIVVPTRVYAAHVHAIVKLERNTDKVVIVNPDDAIVYHLRRVTSRNPPSNRKKDTFLTSFAREWDRQYAERLKYWRKNAAKFKLFKYFERPWPKRGVKIMFELDECLAKEFKSKLKQCQSAWRCKDKLKTIPSYEWLWSNQSWTKL